MLKAFAPQEPEGSVPTAEASSDSSLLKNTLLEHFVDLRDPRIDRTKDQLEA